MRRTIVKTFLLTSLAGALSALAMTANASWPMWESFKAANIDASHRVIDYSDARAITTSEGQSYAMFFALVADDRETFDKLLAWTEQNLAKGDITKNLPSWLWGKNGSSWGIIDSNNATDSDLWIAYDLLEAARIWNAPEYAQKARAMMELLKKDVTAIFAFSDMQAYGVYESAKRAGKRIPDDLSVMGFDDNIYSSVLEVPLSTMRQPVEMIAKEVCRVILALINEEEAPPPACFPAQLVCRESVKTIEK